MLSSKNQMLKKFMRERYPNEDIKSLSKRERKAIINSLEFACYSLQKEFEELILSISIR